MLTTLLFLLGGAISCLGACSRDAHPPEGCGAVIRMSVYTVLGEEVAGDISVALNADGLYLARVPYEVLSRGTLALVAETPCGIVSSLVRYDH